MTTTLNQASQGPQTQSATPEGAIAIIGMSGRFPGAPDVESYWQMLRDGREGVTFFSEEQLLQAGVPRELARDPAYVPARGTIAGADEFDADFFGFSPREAELMDPQLRVFLECAYAACESAGYARLAARAGIFAGMGASAYLLHLARQLDSADSAPILNALILNDKDYLATWTGYKLDLRGPSLTVQTACSTSLVAVHLAAQSLLAGECDVALAGAVSVSFPQEIGYRHDSNGVLSSDGHCRAFDARGEGIVEGNGVGVVVLKRLEDALEAGDSIRGIIRGSAVNNDGSARIGYTAPGVEGQANVVLEALAMAGVPASSIGFVEAHGTGTKMGDPIEVAALSRAHGARSAPCVLGSVKSNIGHLGAASGIAGLVKAVLALEHGEIPPTLHYERSNPSLQLAAAGFEVSNQLLPWPAIAGPRRAAVSSFGIGGTNAHIVLEQAPAPQPSEASTLPSLLVWSARTAAAADAMSERLAATLRAEASTPLLEDVAFTLAAGRRRFAHRRAMTGRDRDRSLRELKGTGLIAGAAPEQRPKVVFLLPGLGDQYAGMAQGPYRDFPAFRAALDRYAEGFVEELGVDVRDLLLATPAVDTATASGRGFGRAGEPAADGLAQTRIAQPALFAMTCALADCLIQWGISPDLLIGHSFGEYAAAYLSGVFSFGAAIKLVSARAKLLDQLEPGALISVLSSPSEVEQYLSDKIFLSAVNAPEICTLAGSPSDIEELATRLAGQGIVTIRLAATHAFHSPMMASAMEPLARVVAELDPKPPRIPYVSNVTGEHIRAEDAVSPTYWARHLRETVRFSSGIRAACQAPHQVLLELGPGTALGSFARMSGVDPTRATLVSCVPGRLESRDGHASLLDAVGKLWCLGIEADFARVAPRGRRVPLPTYPFERQRYVLATKALPSQGPRAASPEHQACGFRLQEVTLARPPESSGPIVVVQDDSEAAAALVGELAQRAQLTRVKLGATLERLPDGSFTIDPTRASDWSALLRAIDEQGSVVEHVVFALGRSREQAGSDLETAAALGTLLALRAALKGSRPLQLTVLASGLQALNESEALDPARAALVGAARVVAQESAGLTVRLIDFAAVGAEPGQTPASRIIEVAIRGTEPLLALRGRQAFVPSLSSLAEPLPPSDGAAMAADELGVTVVLSDAAGSAAVADALRRAGKRVETVADTADLASALQSLAALHGGIERLVWPALQDVPLHQLDDLNATIALSSTLSSGFARVEEALVHAEVSQCSLLLPLSALTGGRGHFQRAALASHAAALAHQANRRAACRFSPLFVERDAGLDQVSRALRHPGPVAYGKAELAELVRSSFGYRPPPLDERTRSSPASVGSYVAPSGELEVAIAHIWEDLLGLAHVGVNDNFFEFGGQSLMGLQLLSRIKASYGVELTLRDLFDAPTVAEQAFRVESSLLSQIESEFPAAVGQGDAA